jgi:hypothetical protein
MAGGGFFVANPHFSRRYESMTGMTPFIAAGFDFSSAGVPPGGLRGVKIHKITGETPALPIPLPKPSFDCSASAEQKLV